MHSTNIAIQLKIIIKITIKIIKKKNYFKRNNIDKQ